MYNARKDNEITGQINPALIIYVWCKVWKRETDELNETGS